MQMDDEVVTPYKKKRRRRPPKKADHKHEFVDCVFEFNPETCRYLIDRREFSIGSYCPTCGKVGSTAPIGGIHGKWKMNTAEPPYICPAWTDAAEREFDPETRTLPYFMLNDWFQKFVDLEGSLQEVE